MRPIQFQFIKLFHQFIRSDFYVSFSSFRFSFLLCWCFAFGLICFFGFYLDFPSNSLHAFCSGSWKNLFFCSGILRRQFYRNVTYKHTEWVFQKKNPDCQYGWKRVSRKKWNFFFIRVNGEKIAFYDFWLFMMIKWKSSTISSTDRLFYPFGARFHHFILALYHSKGHDLRVSVTQFM